MNGTPETPDVTASEQRHNEKLSGVQQYTDIGFAHTFADLHRDRVRYVPKFGQWIVWNRDRWNTDDRDVLVTRLAEDVAKSIFPTFAEMKTLDSANVTAATNAAKNASSTRSITNFLKLARGAPGIAVEPNDLDSDPWLFGVENGYIDLRDGSFHEPDPKKLITKTAPVTYDKEATAPRFEKSLAQWHPDPAMPEYVQRIAGHAIAGEYRGDHVMVILYGFGRNGKGTFVKTMKEVFGPYFIVPNKALLLRMSRDEHATVRASLFGTRLAVASETDQQHKLNEAEVKNLTGGDQIGAHKMRQDEWWFEPTHSIWLQTNYLPSIKGTDLGIWSRIRVVPWLERFDGAAKDPDLDEALRTEKPGILNWIIEGCLRWRAEGLDRIPDLAAEATKQYVDSQNVLIRFIEETDFWFGVDGDDRTTHAEITKAVADWCDEEGVRTPDAEELNRWLTVNGCRWERKRIDGGRRVKVWNGIYRATRDDEQQKELT